MVNYHNYNYTIIILLSWRGVNGHSPLRCSDFHIYRPLLLIAPRPISLSVIFPNTRMLSSGPWQGSSLKSNPHHPFVPPPRVKTLRCCHFICHNSSHFNASVSPFCSSFLLIKHQESPKYFLGNIRKFYSAKCQNNLAINTLVNPKIVNVHKTNPVQTDGSFYCRYIGTKIIIFTFSVKINSQHYRDGRRMLQRGTRH